jgi:hypothetical protein
MVNYLAKFIPEPSTVAHPLYELLRGDTEWTWDAAHCEAFRNLKNALATAPVLTCHDANKPTIVSADSSSYGLGGVLLQQHRELETRGLLL